MLMMPVNNNVQCLWQMMLALFVVDMDDVASTDGSSTFVDNVELNVHVVPAIHSATNELISTFLLNIADNHFHNHP
jgi:hypothetical protein